MLCLTVHSRKDASNPLSKIEWLGDTILVHVCTSTLLYDTERLLLLVHWSNTVNSLMFAGINVCVFKTKPCSRGLIFVVSSGLVSYLGT